MAVSGHNGNNETLIGMSTSVGLSFYDENLEEIKITKSLSPIDILIKRDPNLPEYPYQYVNATQIQITKDSYFMPNGFNISYLNTSIHVELKPLNLNIGYLIVMKLGYTPIINYTYLDYDFIKNFCPSKILFLTYF